MLTPKVFPPTNGTQPGIDTLIPLSLPIALLISPMTALTGLRTALLIPLKARLAMPDSPFQALDSAPLTLLKTLGTAEPIQLTTGLMTRLMAFQAPEITLFTAFITVVMTFFHALKYVLMTVATAFTTAVMAFLMPFQTVLISFPIDFMIGLMTFMAALTTWPMTAKAFFMIFCNVFDLVAICTTFSMSGVRSPSSIPMMLPFISLFSVLNPPAAFFSPPWNFPMAGPPLPASFPTLETARAA